VESSRENGTPGHTTVPSWRQTLFADILKGVRLRSSIYFRPEFGAPWGVSIADHGPVFHIIATGTCWLRADRLDKPLMLASGDLVVVTRGDGHVVSDDPATPVVHFSNFFDLVKRHASGANVPFRVGGEGPTTRFVCGGMQFENGANNPLLAVLPPFLHVRGSESGGLPWLRLTVEHILAELDSGPAGAAEVVTRLADILFIQAVRAYFHQNADIAQSGWLAAARDRQIGQALALLHAKPDEHWTIDILARRLATSRSSFADRFSELVGEPPLRYLSRLRIDAAARRLRSSDDKLSAVAAAAGYESVSAFNRAFKRQVGMTPGGYRNCKDLGCSWDSPRP
jgi:AraC-like DNA-binding protein